MQEPDATSKIKSFYQRRLEALRVETERVRRQETLASRWRGIAFVAIGLFLLVQMGYVPSVLGYVLAAIIMAVFVALVGYHERIQAELAQLQVLKDFNLGRLARLHRQWESIPSFDADEQLARQPVANDLDLLSERSVVRFVSEASTVAGRSQLQSWLTEPATPEQIVRRQEAVRYLSGETSLREEVALRGRMLNNSGASPENLAAWGRSPAHLPERPWIVWGMWLGPTVLVAFSLLVLSGSVPSIWSLGIFAAIAFNLIFSVLFLGPIHDIFNAVTVGEREIDHYRALFRTVWQLPDDVDAFAELRKGMQRHSVDFERALDELRRLVRLGSGRRSGIWFPFYIIAQFALLWDFHVMRRLERWQRSYGTAPTDWFKAVGTLESLCSFAALAHDHPDWCVPQVEIDDSPHVVHFRQLGHPLLAPDHCVRNDVNVGPRGELLLVTGSNMSGKSTLLRSIGVNIMLAQAGSVACAEAMALQPVCVATSMRVHDSLADGVSFFMAELQRLKAIVDEARGLQSQERCMVFLLDEILQGTNSRERHIAVQRIIRHLIESGATGAISTHDLELGKSPDLAPHSKAVHFRESFGNDGDVETMQFDYLLREGICPTTNALKLLEHVGLA